MKLSVNQPINGSTEVSINASSPLGRGADAFIYRASIGGKQYAAKIYHDPGKLDVKKLSAMIGNPPTTLVAKTAGIEYPTYAWPIAILLDAKKKSVGFLMPLIDLNNSFTLDYYYDPGLIGKLNSADEHALSYRVEIAANLSALLSDLHKHHHFFIDLKPQNIRVFKKTHAVTLIDCDGFSIYDPSTGKTYPATMYSADYISPEALRSKLPAQDLKVGQDLFALATIIFQLFNGGIHPFQGILQTRAGDFNTNDDKVMAGLYPHGIKPNLKISPRPQSVHECFHDETRILFDRAFTGSENGRPTASEWADHLNRLYKGQQLARCDKFPNDIKHMRWRNKPCPCCTLELGQKQVRQAIRQLPSPIKPVASTFKKIPSNIKSNVRPISSSTNTALNTPSKAKSESTGWKYGGGIVLAIFMIFKAFVLVDNKVNCAYYPANSQTNIAVGKCSIETTTSELASNAVKRQTLTMDIQNVGQKQIFFTYYRNGSILTQGGSLANKGRWSTDISAQGWIGIQTTQGERYWFMPK